MFLFSSYIHATTAIECSTTDAGEAVINELFASSTQGTQKFVELKSLVVGASSNWQFCYKQASSSEVCINIPNQSFNVNEYFVGSVLN
jgi:hypothetical protein